MIQPSLNLPQARFLQLPHKYRAYVAGFGCLRADALVVTEHGPMPIREIDRPMRVLSWSAVNSRFELALSGGAFPKGAANLYRVETQRGEFVASGHHHVLCADGSYRPVESLRVSERVFASSQNLRRTNLGDFPKSLHADGRHSIETLADSMGRYANAARQYGQQLLFEAGIDLVSAPSQGDVPGFVQTYGLEGDHVVPEPRRSHQDLEFSQLDSRGLVFRDVRREAGARHCLFAQTSCAASELNCSDECSDKHGCYRNQRAWPPLMPCGQVTQADKWNDQGASFNFSEIESCDIISITRLNEVEAYYDLQVLDNNCYVTVDGAIHHNSGKTWAGCASISQNAWQWPKVNQGYFAPTYPQIRDIFFPTIEEAAFNWGLKADIKEANKEVHLFRGAQYRSTIICRSMEKPSSIVGFKIGHALVDELDVMQAAKAEQAWNKIIARMRYNVDGLKNGIDVTTTPEGFKFVYQRFWKQPRDKPSLDSLYGMVQASTYDNAANLPDDYIPSLLASYPSQLIEAYLNGQFTNLTAGSVYPDFDRKLNNTHAFALEREPVLIGLDFNRLNMSSVIYVERDGWPVAVDEITDGRDTPYMARLFKERYLDKGHAVQIFPDASGGNSSSKNASESDLSILRAHGFTIRAHATNPAIVDRVNAVNALICNGEGVRRLKVNTNRCPKLTDALEQQAYDKNGMPDKSSGIDHVIDSAGYPLAYKWPVVKKSAAVTNFKW